MSIKLNIGQVCAKTAGKEKGSRCVVIDNVDENFVIIAGIDVKRRRCNVKHLKPLLQRLTIKKNAVDNEVLEAMFSAGLVEEKSAER